jgi:hypothetical protein
MTSNSNLSSQLTEVTQSGVKVKGIIRDCTIEVTQVVSKDNSVVDQSGVRSFGSVDTKIEASQSVEGVHLSVTQKVIEAQGRL